MNDDTTTLSSSFDFTVDGLISAFNPWDIPNWMLVGILAVVLGLFVVSMLLLDRDVEQARDREFAERAERLGFSKTKMGDAEEMADPEYGENDDRSFERSAHLIKREARREAGHA